MVNIGVIATNCQNYDLKRTVFKIAGPSKCNTVLGFRAPLKYAFVSLTPQIKLI